MRKIAENKWLYIRVGFIAVFVIVATLIVFGKVSEYNNENKDVVTASVQYIDDTETLNYKTFTF